jgi:murein DD-endopeptidase MepM/ murein hydrolase activator NlpD
MTGTARTSLTGLVKPALVALCAVLIMNILAAASALAEPSAAASEHVVRPGETLYSLARRYGVSLAQLQAANGVAAPDKVQAGTRLRIPAAQGKVLGVAAARDASGTPQAARAGADAELAKKWNRSDQTAAIMGDPPKPEPPKNGSMLDIPLKGGATLSPEHRDAGAVIVSDAASKNEDFQGHALGVRTTLPAGKDTQVVSTLGYGVSASVKEDDATRLGYKTDTSIGGLGYGLGLRHSF